MEETNRYDRCMNRVIEAIEADLEFVDIETLIRVSGYSYYHFHRIFKTHTGESLKKYIKRLQLERALHKMKMDKENITRLALEAGFHMSSSFNKAFKEMFDVSPREYKKILARKRQGYADIEPAGIERWAAFDAYVLRYVGVCASIDGSFDVMLDFAKTHGLAGDGFELYGITYDDPEVTDGVKLRYDICIKKTKDVPLSKESPIVQKRIEGGKYALFSHSGGPDTLVDAYNSIFGKWLYNNDIDLRNTPVVQRILYDPEVSSVSHNRVEICIPIV